jgi:hypothetical protein
MPSHFAILVLMLFYSSNVGILLYFKELSHFCDIITELFLNDHDLMQEKLLLLALYTSDSI